MSTVIETSAPLAGESWRPRRVVVFAALLLAYPVGLVLLLVSPRPARFRKFLIAAVFGLVFSAALNQLFGLSVYTDGSGWQPHVGFRGGAIRKMQMASYWAGQSASTGAFVFRDDIDAAAQWPEFRGLRRDGIVRGQKLSLPWPKEGPRIVWKKPIGGGFASFAVFGGAAYTIEQRGDQEALVCYRVADGEEIWSRKYDARFREALGGNGPRATPTVADGNVYFLGATGILTCLSASDGAQRWRRNILDDAGAENLHWGMSGSPLVRGGRVYVTPGGPGASIVAYDAGTGEPIWRSGSQKAAYCSLSIETIAGAEQLLNFNAEGLTAYGLKDGAKLWSFPWRTSYDINCGQPIAIGDSRVFISSGYSHGCAMLKIEAKDNGLFVEELWSTKSLKLKFSSAVLSEGFIYGLDEKILVCVDVETGERRWKGGRYGFGQLILADGYLIVQCEDGDLALVEASPESHKEAARVKALSGKTWNHPAISDGRLLLRNDREMMCIDLRAPIRSN
jgi:outer membrane protein assembly factor BamB